MTTNLEPSKMLQLQREYQTFKAHQSQYSIPEREIIRRKRLNATEPVVLPETKPFELSHMQREKMLLEARKQINRELRQVRNQIKRSK